MTSPFKNILLIQFGDIGDVVLTTPAIRAVKETYPEARISILVRKPYGSILTADPSLHEVVEATKMRGTLLHVLREHARFTLRLRRARYDLVIDLRTGDRGALMSFLTRAPERVGTHIEKPFWHDLLFTKLIRDPPVAPPPVHPGADQSLRVVREIGIDTADSMPRLYITAADRTRAFELLAECGLGPGGRWVTVNPFSRWKYKEWDNGKWGDVIDRLWGAHRFPSVLIGSGEEAAACGEIVTGREGRAFTLAGKTTLGELAAVVATSTLHLGVDSAAPHIAAAVGTPTVTIHGPTDWRAWRVADNLHRIVTATMECVPCNRMGCDDKKQSRCLQQLEPETVIKAMDGVLRRVRDAGG